ncbi:MAG: hypothetical protein IJJ71_12210 [Treponema sp.]|uniref:hypothetical protein n=1 Tax=Treponema sp. TaxID=166 RepID=UPI0025EE6A77|nr:hypothetical protein [Treponema sp.]MBQ7538610.1 hypothetical protein [Treponema sp.]MBR0496927.1 hypothetical protein [Treponema sp.]
MTKNHQTEPLEIFLPYQKKWLEDKSDLKIIEKNRRCGISWTDSADSVLDAAPAHGWSNTYYMSFNKDNCRQYIEDAGEWAKKLGYAVSEIIEEEEPLLDDDEKSITTYRITFSSGAEIMGLPGVSRSLRSKQGNVVIDEAAFFDDLESVLQAAKALVMWGGRIRVISTHNGDDNPFNILIKNIRSGKEKEWSLHRITFREAMAQGLYKRICLKQGRKWTPEADKKFMDKMYRIYGDNPDEELDVIPRASGDRYFSRGLLDHATADAESYDIRRLECSDSFLHKSEAYKNREIEKFFNQEVRPVLGSLEGLVFGGNDFGRSGDLTTYWISEEVAKTQLAVRLIVELKNAPFEQQQYFNDMLTDFLCEERHRLGGIAIDSRGNGQQIGEHAMLRHPGAAIQVMETNAWYAKYGTDLHGLMESADFTVPDDETIKADFAIVTLKNGIPTIPAVRTADRDLKGKRHGDGASAAMLCVCAWRECAADPAPVFASTEKKKQKGFLWW